jgi:hypothetical protein
MSGSNGGRLAIGLGILAVAAIPAGVAVAWRRPEVSLLRGLEVAVAAAFVLSLLAVLAARRARFRVDRSVTRKGASLVRTGRTLAWTGLYLALAGGVALGFYGLLELRG